jgi:hypothetical protein
MRGAAPQYWPRVIQPLQARRPELALPLRRLALLHAVSSAQIRGLTITGVDDRHRTLALPGPPFPTPADPATWAALQACLAYREAFLACSQRLCALAVPA